MTMTGKFLAFAILILTLGLGIGVGIFVEKRNAPKNVQDAARPAKPSYITEDLWRPSRLREAEYRAVKFSLTRGFKTISSPLYADEIMVFFEPDFVYLYVTTTTNHPDWRSHGSADSVEKAYAAFCDELARRAGHLLDISTSRIRIFVQSLDSSETAPFHRRADECFWVDGKFSACRTASQNRGLEPPTWAVQWASGSSPW